MVQCNFCNTDILDESELTLTCGHNICNICLSHELLLSKLKAIEDNFTISLTCPCGGNLSLSVDRFYALMTKQPSYSNTKTCNKHSQPFSTYCTDCKIWLCEECKTEFHNDYFIAHLISNQAPSKSKCFYHKSNIKNIFCKNCNELICETCAIEESHNNHLSLSMEKLRDKKAQLKKTMKFKTYAQIEDFITENERNIVKDIIGRIASNNRAINQSIKALEEIKNKNFTRTDVLLKNLANLFKVVKQCYKTYYDDLNDNKIVLSSMEFIFKMNQELSRINYQPIIQNELERVNEILEEVSQKNFFNVNFTFQGCKIKTETSVYTESSVTALCPLQNKGIACGMQNGKINIMTYLESESDYRTSELIGHLAPVNTITPLFNNSNDNNSHADKTISTTRIASGSSDNSIRIWNYTRGECLYNYNTLHKGSIWDILELDDGRIVSSSSDDTIKIWRIEESNEPLVISQDTKFESCLCIVNDSSFASGSGDGTVKIWNSYNGTCNWLLLGHKDYINCIINISNGVIASGSADTDIIIWNTMENSRVILSKHKDIIQKLLSFNDKYFISCSRDKTMILWDFNVYECVFIINEAHSSNIYGLIKTSDSKLVSGGNDNTINIWDTTDINY